MFWMSSGLISASTCSSSASLGWRGKAAGLVLQVLRAQQRKFRVRSFMFSVLVLLFVFLFGMMICRSGVSMLSLLDVFLQETLRKPIRGGTCDDADRVRVEVSLTSVHQPSNSVMAACWQFRIVDEM